MVGELQKSGNLTGLYMAEEEALNQLPVTPIWFEREPNSYADFGGAYDMTTRTPITHDRQHRKGETSDNNPTAGFQEDFTLTNMERPFQGFLFADAREKQNTAPLNGPTIPITSVTAATYAAAAGLDMFLPGHTILAAGFLEPDNNGINIVASATATAITTESPLVAEAAPAPTATVQAVGFTFGAGELTLDAMPDRVELNYTGAADLTTLGLTPGEWIGVGGDDAATQFAATGDNAPFYGQVDSISADKIVLRKTTGTQIDDAGAAKTIQIWFGTVIRNEDDCTLIKLRTWTLERQYGCAPDAEAEYVGGAAANQFTITVPTPAADAKVTVDLTYIACVSYERTGELGDEILGGTRVGALNEPCFKPGLDVYEHKLNIIDPATLNPTGLVGYNSEATLVVNNNLTGNKAIETFGNAGINIGEFSVTGTLTAYFPGVMAARRVRHGAELTWHLILTKANTAVITDMASLGLGNARANVEPNAPVTLPLDTAAGKGKYGYSLLVTFLHYVPAALMAKLTQ